MFRMTILNENIKLQSHLASHVNTISHIIIEVTELSCTFFLVMCSTTTDNTMKTLKSLHINKIVKKDLL